MLISACIRLALLRPSQRRGQVVRRRFCATGYCGDSSSTSNDEVPFDIQALAIRCGISERKVRRAVSALHAEGFPFYGRGDHIPKMDQHVIAELGLGIQLPREKFPLRDGDPVKSTTTDQRDTQGVKEPLDAQESIPFEDLEALVSNGVGSKPDDVRRLVKELRQPKYGFDVRTANGVHIDASNGERFILLRFATRPNKGALTQKMNSIVDTKALLQFVRANLDPGKVRCGKCRKWFDTFSQDPVFRDELCLGYCDRARKSGEAR